MIYSITFGLAIVNWLLYVSMLIHDLLDEDPLISYHKMCAGLSTIIMLFTLFNMIANQ